MFLITVLTHIVTVFSVARSQKNFCSMGKILGNTKIFVQSIRSICFFVKVPVFKQDRP